MFPIRGLCTAGYCIGEERTIRIDSVVGSSAGQRTAPATVNWTRKGVNKSRYTTTAGVDRKIRGLSLFQKESHHNVLVMYHRARLWANSSGLPSNVSRICKFHAIMYVCT